MVDSSVVDPATRGDHLVHQGEVRTQLECHSCSSDFIALLDYSIEGNHIIECPNCSHEHCRVITKGKVTGDRWDARNGNDKSLAARPRRVWKHNVLQVQTSSTSEFIRSKWLERYTQGR